MGTELETSRDSRALSFLRAFLRNPRQVGALCPSSRHLADAMLESLELRPGDLLLEYGPGTGGLTGSIQRLVRARGLRYLGIEREAEFCHILRARFPGLDFAHGRVEEVERLLAERGLSAPRAILSGLPLTVLPTRAAIVRDASRVLAPGGSFRTFTYLQSRVTPGPRRLSAVLRDSFARVRYLPLVWRNFPPAFVLCGEEPTPRAQAVCAAP